MKYMKKSKQKLTAFNGVCWLTLGDNFFSLISRMLHLCIARVYRATTSDLLDKYERLVPS